MSETGVVPDEPEATIRVVLLPAVTKHLGLDLGVLGPGLTPCGVQGLIEVLNEVRRLAEGEEHLVRATETKHLWSICNLVQAPSTTKHLLSECGQQLELVSRPTSGWWRCPAKGNNRDLVTHHTADIGLNDTGEDHRHMRGQCFLHPWGQHCERVQGDRAVSVESPSR